MNAIIRRPGSGRSGLRCVLAALATVVVLALVAAAPARAGIEIERVESKGGIKAWLVRDKINPIISMTVLIRHGGSALDPAGKEGLARFTAALLDEGAGTLNSQAFQRRLEDRSISLGFSAGRDHLSITLRTLRRNRAEAFELLKLAITEPRFDAEPVARVRSQLLAGLRRRSVSPRYIASRAWWSTAYKGHAYGRPSRGTAETIKAIGPGDFWRYVRARFARDALVIGVTGDIAPAELSTLLDRTFGKLAAVASPAKQGRVAAKTDGTVKVIKRPFPQSVVVFGQSGPARRDRDYYATFVMNHILGGGSFSSRLYQEVREKRGLAYSVGSYLNPMLRSALIVGSVATQNARVKETITQIKAQWKLMAEKGASAEELKQAKLYLTGSYPLRFTNTARIASLLAWVQMLDLGIDYIDHRNAIIEKITLDDVRRAAKRFLKSGTLFFIVVGNPKDMG